MFRLSISTDPFRTGSKIQAARLYHEYDCLQQVLRRARAAANVLPRSCAVDLRPEAPAISGSVDGAFSTVRCVMP